jgi:hypothetical protein
MISAEHLLKPAITEPSHITGVERDLQANSRALASHSNYIEGMLLIHIPPFAAGRSHTSGEEEKQVNGRE